MINQKAEFIFLNYQEEIGTVTYAFIVSPVVWHKGYQNVGAFWEDLQNPKIY